MRDPARPVFCLIVEDDPVVGLDLADALSRAGWYVAGPFTSGAEALNWLARFTPDIAFANPKLADGLHGEVLTELTNRQIPFVIHARHKVRERAAGLPRLRTAPVTFIIEAALSELFSLAAQPR